MIKILSLAVVFAVLTGCATPAQISMPVVQKVSHEVFVDKRFTYDLLYSQPEPGVFSSGEQQAMQPIEQAKLSVASAKALHNVKRFIEEQLPASSTVVQEGSGDFDLMIKLKAKHKKGPAYADFEAAKSFGKSLLTMGFGSSEYDIVADFEVTYELQRQGRTLFTKHYVVEDSVDHQRGKLDGFEVLNVYAAEMLEKHMMLTLNDFFKSASQKL